MSINEPDFPRQKSYWTMEFDVNPRVMEELQARLRQDPTVLRSTTLKLGDQLMQSVRHPQQTEQKSYRQLFLGQ